MEKPEIHKLEYFELQDLIKYFDLGDIYEHINNSDICYGCDEQNTLILNTYLQNIIVNSYDHTKNIISCLNFLNENEYVDILI